MNIDSHTEQGDGRFNTSEAGNNLLLRLRDVPLERTGKRLFDDFSAIVVEMTSSPRG
jgi:hypothetical protein